MILFISYFKNYAVGIEIAMLKLFEQVTTAYMYDSVVKYGKFSREFLLELPIFEVWCGLFCPAIGLAKQNIAFLFIWYIIVSVFFWQCC